MVNFCLLLRRCSKQLRLELSANVLHDSVRFGKFVVTIDDVRYVWECDSYVILALFPFGLADLVGFLLVVYVRVVKNVATWVGSMGTPEIPITKDQLV